MEKEGNVCMPVCCCFIMFTIAYTCVAVMFGEWEGVQTPSYKEKQKVCKVQLFFMLGMAASFFLFGLIM